MEVACQQTADMWNQICKYLTGSEFTFCTLNTICEGCKLKITINFIWKEVKRWHDKLILTLNL